MITTIIMNVKKTNWCIIKTFLGPFFLYFSVLFFIFIVQFAWQQMEKFIGKGLKNGTLLPNYFFG